MRAWHSKQSRLFALQVACKQWQESATLLFVESVSIITMVAQRLPLVLLFAGGYLVYRLLFVTKVTDALVFWAVRRSGGKPQRLILYIIIAAALLSAFIPNAITVLTLLPMLTLLDKDFRAQGVEGMTTPLMVAAIYGAGIGGMASMIGTPANAVLLVALDVLKVPGREAVTFFTWFFWSIPLAVMMTGAAWATAGFLGVPRSVRRVRLRLDALEAGRVVHPARRRGVFIFVVFLGYWILEALARALYPAIVEYLPLFSLAFSALFFWLLFLWKGKAGVPVLVARDVFTGIPRRGVAFLLLLVVIFAVAQGTGVGGWLMSEVVQRLHLSMPAWLVFFLTVLSVIFLTEVLSNTVVVAGFFTLIYGVAPLHGIAPLPLMIAVSVASTCAFMTPIATPSNALAFGEMRGARLKAMFFLGALLNILGAIIISCWLNYVLPILYPPPF